MSLLATQLLSLPHVLADFWLPEQASNLAKDVDWAWNVILWVTGAFFCIVVGAMTFFIFKYKRRTPNDQTSHITHNTPLEIVWTIVPLILVIMFFFVGFKGFINYDTPASDCVNVYSVASKWSFSFQYSNGAQAPDLYLLEGQNVKINMTSKDVLHALFLPEFRTQRNYIPYRETFIWFQPTKLSPKEGWPVYCTQYCGNGHSRMIARVYVLAKAEYDEKMNELANPFKKKNPDGTVRYVPYYKVGEQLWSENCKTCHSADGSAGTGPTWKGLWKRPHQFSYIDPSSYGGAGFTLGPGDSDEKWHEYLKESMLRPDAKLAIGGKSASGMSSFASQFSGSEVNVEKQRALDEYIKSLGDQPYDKPDEKGTDPAYDALKTPNHPESLAAKAATQSRPASGPGQ